MNSKQFEDMLDRAMLIDEYMQTCSEECRPKYETRRIEYSLKSETLDTLKKVANQFIIVAIGADWCKDCVANIAVLDLIHEATGIPVYILGGVKTDPLNPNRQWAVPPSPPEVDSLKIKAIPTILLYTPDGIEIARIIENPQILPTLEEELLYLIENYLA
ncbi:MAG: thioredoxin family protein [Promethearchaeota archaeon]